MLVGFLTLSSKFINSNNKKVLVSYSEFLKSHVYNQFMMRIF